jgi:hypothetical protein
MTARQNIGAQIYFSQIKIVIFLNGMRKILFIYGTREEIKRRNILIDKYFLLFLLT